MEKKKKIGFEAGEVSFPIPPVLFRRGAMPELRGRAGKQLGPIMLASD
jgi:hypothetical protein